MNRSYSYAIAQLHANPVRGERLNLAIVVFGDDAICVHAARNLDKLRAISGSLDLSLVQSSLHNLAGLDDFVRGESACSLTERVKALSDLSPIQFSELGEFFASDSATYQHTIRRLMTDLIEPEPPLYRVAKRKTTRLITSIKTAFRAEKILARKGEGIDSHRVITNHEIVEGLNADLILKNGAMHIFQTVDASHTERARHAIREIGMSVLVFEQARMNYGAHSTIPRLVYAANSQLERSISPSLDAAEHQGASLVNWDSRDDRTKFVVEISMLAQPIVTVAKSGGRIIASTQDRFKLN